MMSELKLTDRSWQCFSVKNIFDIFTGALLNKEIVDEGNIPRITATDLNNGIALFTSSISNKNFRTFSNFISISFLGSVFYQPYTVSLDMKIHGIRPKYIELNKYIAHFLIPLIKKFTFKYTYGYQLSNSVLESQKIMLPIDENGQPDWQFMEKFMRQIEQNKIQTLLKYYKSLNYFGNSGGGVFCRTQIKWAVFAIEDVCEILSGVRLTKQDMIIGNLPFVGASDSNNGITAFVANQNSSLDKNVLGVNYNGSVVENFYHPYECLFSDDVKRLKIKSENADKYAYLFLKVAILQQKSKYQYGYKFNATRMSRQKIMLPENENGQPNWAYMSQYMQQIELRQIMRYLVFQVA